MRYGILLCAVCGYQVSADKWTRHCNGCMPGVQASAPYRAIMDNIMVRIDDAVADIRPLPQDDTPIQGARTVINSGRTSMKFQLSVCLIAYCPFRGTPSMFVAPRSRRAVVGCVDVVGCGVVLCSSPHPPPPPQSLFFCVLV